MLEKNSEASHSQPQPAESVLDKVQIRRHKKTFPTAVDFLVFLGIFFVAQLVGAMVALASGCSWPDLPALTGDDEAARRVAQIALASFNAVSYCVAMTLTLGGFIYYRSLRRGPRNVARYSLRGLNPMLLLWGVVLVLAISVVLEPLLMRLPAPPDIYGRGGWALLTLVVAAPLLEEFIFRGVILESTRAKYGVVAAWIISSLIFGIVHIYPAVVVNAFAIGLVLGFVYIISESIWAVIILHAVNNAVAYLLLSMGHANMELADIVKNKSIYILIYLVAAAVAIVSGYMVWRTLKRLKAEEKNGAEE